jgi:formylglycine-generating enzyme required for sulfatase activity
VQFIGNVVDQSALESGRPIEWGYPPWHDGFVASAPVGSFAPNSFGLHDVIGNVWEWCRDRYGSYDNPVAAGDGERLGTDSEERVIRGGDYNAGPARARVSWRGDMPVHSSDRIGLRPVRTVEAAQNLRAY